MKVVLPETVASRARPEDITSQEPPRLTRNGIRILHIAAFSSAVGNIGVVRQMQSERNSARDLGINWDIELWAADSVDGLDFVCVYPPDCKGRISRRRHFFERVTACATEYDVILLRYLPADPFLPFLRRGTACLALVLHTKDSMAIRTQFGFWKGLFFSVADWVTCQFVLRKAVGLVAVTGDILEYHRDRTRLNNVPGIVIPNGIDLRRFSMVDDNRQGTIKLLFIASTFFSWHGLALLLKSLADYPRRRSIELHLVGNVQKADVQFIRESGLEDCVHLHGSLDLSQLRHSLSQADVGIASFGLGDTGLVEACTLKVREYLAAGVPVYSGHRDVAFPAGSTFYRVGAPDIGAIVEFACRMRRFKRSEIRHATEKAIDKSLLVAHLNRWLEEICAKNTRM